MIFIDTGPFLARYLEKDQYHGRALEAWSRLEKSRERCCTSNYVLDELFTLLARRAAYGFAATKARLLYSSQLLEVLRPQEKEEHRAIDYFEKYADQSLSFTDCVSFALMKHHSIKKAFTFDRHFERAGFRVWA